MLTLWLVCGVRHCLLCLVALRVVVLVALQVLVLVFVCCIFDDLQLLFFV